MAEEFELSILTTRFLLITFVLMYISFLKRKITVSFFGPPVIEQVFFDFWAIEADLIRQLTYHTPRMLIYCRRQSRRMVTYRHHCQMKAPSFSPGNESDINEILIIRAADDLGCASKGRKIINSQPAQNQQPACDMPCVQPLIVENRLG